MERPNTTRDERRDNLNMMKAPDTIEHVWSWPQGKQALSSHHHAEIIEDGGGGRLYSLCAHVLTPLSGEKLLCRAASVQFKCRQEHAQLVQHDTDSTDTVVGRE